MLRDKTVIIGVTGSIAAYKIASLASALVKEEADVHVLMTANASHFINPITFETLTGNRCQTDTFDRDFHFEVEHVALAKKADIFMVAPASADIIAKLAHGIAEDMLTTTMLACECPVLVAPAMNVRMYENPIVQDNMGILKHYGMKIIEPATGYLACGDTGKGKMVEPEILFHHICQEIAYEKDMKGLHVLVTAGPTQEAIDPVRYITNHSSGKMGYAVARACAMRGADVTLVSGPADLETPLHTQRIDVTSAREMYQEVINRADQQDIIIKAAAVADYSPADVAKEKIKKTDSSMTIAVEKTDDILKTLGEQKKKGQFLCGFSMETENVLQNSREKLQRKNLDMIVANNLRTVGAGFAGDTNVITIITADEEMELGLMSKEEAAHRILDQIMRMR